MLPTPDVLQTFDLGTATAEPVEVARGAVGRIFRVQTSTGLWAIKELFASAEAHAPPQPLETQASLIEAAARTGVTAPRIVRTRDGHIVALIDGVRWRAYEWINIAGTPTLHQAGATLARLHAAGWPTTDPIDPWYRDRTVTDPWEKLLDRAQHQPWAPLLRDQIPELTALDAIPKHTTVPPCRMCHGDFTESNLALDQTGRVVVLDWDNTGPLPPEWEVAYVLLDGSREHWPTKTPAGVREFVSAYRDEGGTFNPAGVEVFSAVIAAHHNYLAKMIDQTIAGDPWSLESVESILAHPIRLTRLQKILDTVP